MNKRTKKTLTILIIGCAILTWRVYAMVTEYVPSPVEAGASSEHVERSAPASTANRVDNQAHVWRAQRKVASQPWGTKSPFSKVPWAPQTEVVVEVPEIEEPSRDPPDYPHLKLKGVSKSKDRWMAALGGSIVREGDLIEGQFKVTRITHNSVTVTSQGWAITYVVGAEKASLRPITEGP